MSDSGRGEDLRGLKIIVNFRPIVFAALSFAVGIFFFGKYRGYGFLALALAETVVLSFSLFIAALCRGRKFSNYCAVALCLAAFCLFGFLIASARFDFRAKQAKPRGDYVVTGVVVSSSTYGGSTFATLSNCEYNGKKGGDIYLKYLDVEVEKYDVLTAFCHVEPTRLTDGVGVSGDLRYGRTATSSKIYDVEVVGKDSSISARFAAFTDKIFLDGLGSEERSIAAALLRGDTSEMKNVEVYRLSGISHVFAVSGMHVGLIAAALSLVFKLFGIKGKFTPFILSAALFFYAYLCSMTASSVRAAVMCSCLAITNGFGEKGDRVDSMGVALFVTLAIDPFDLFSAGFILSFAASFAIITLAPPIRSVLSFLPGKFADSLSVVLAAQCASAPLSVVLFGTFPIVSLFSNLVLAPLVSLAFYALWIGVAICAILPINRLICLYLPNVTLYGLSKFGKIFAGFPLSVDGLPIALCLLSLAFILASSDVVNVGKRTKVVCAALSLALFSAGFFL